MPKVTKWREFDWPGGIDEAWGVPEVNVANLEFAYMHPDAFRALTEDIIAREDKPDTHPALLEMRQAVRAMMALEDLGVIPDQFEETTKEFKRLRGD